MRRSSLPLTCVAATLLVGTAASAAVHAPASSCAKGSVPATIARKQVCLKAGLTCTRSDDSRYRGYGFACSTGTLTQLWQLTDLGTLGGSESQAKLINDRGQIVGQSDTPTGLGWFLWERGKMTNLGSLGGGQVRAMNVRGQIVGWKDNGAGGRAFLWQNGKMTDLGTLGGTDAQASAINDSGQVVGYSSTADGATHAFLWRNGKMTDLGTLVGGAGSGAMAINNHGQIVGWADTATGDTHAFLWQNGKMTDLGKPAGMIESGATMIGDGGEIVGHATHDDGNNEVSTRPVVWWSGKMTVLPRGEHTYPQAINAGGKVVGYMFTARGRWHAFVWQKGKLTDLGTFGASQSWAYAVNDHGQVAGYVGWPDRDVAFAWKKGGVTLLSDGEAAAINEHGQVVGYVDTATGEHAALWTLKPRS